jgi:site-specific recombinase XerD
MRWIELNLHVHRPTASQPSPAADLRECCTEWRLYAAGLRRAEVMVLEVSDYDPETGGIIVRGKGNKVRIAYMMTMPPSNGGVDLVTR